MATEYKETFDERLRRPIRTSAEGVRYSICSAKVLGEDGLPVRVMTVVGYDGVNSKNRPLVLDLA